MEDDQTLETLMATIAEFEETLQAINESYGEAIDVIALYTIPEMYDGGERAQAFFEKSPVVEDGAVDADAKPKKRNYKERVALAKEALGVRTDLDRSQRVPHLTLVD